MQPCAFHLGMSIHKNSDVFVFYFLPSECSPYNTLALETASSLFQILKSKCVSRYFSHIHIKVYAVMVFHSWLAKRVLPQTAMNAASFRVFSTFNWFPSRHSLYFSSSSRWNNQTKLSCAPWFSRNVRSRACIFIYSVVKSHMQSTVLGAATINAAYFVGVQNCDFVRENFHNSYFVRVKF